MGQLIASLFGIAMPEVQEPENAAMCVSALIDAIAMPETVDTNIQAHSKADLSGFAMPSAQEPLFTAAFADGNLDAEAMPHSSDTVHGAGSASGELQCIAYPNSYGLVFTSGLASGELTGIGLGSTAETVHPTGIASGKLSGALLPAIADVSNIQMAAAGEMEGTASPQQQEPEQTTMGTTAELVCSACPVALKIYTVTFVYDGEELYTAKVLEGYDCPDPLTTGDVEKQTKEMTVQYTYEHTGWSRTEGGAPDPDALANITEDTVLYAAFTESIRYYTVWFYDGTTLVDTVSAPYGGTAETTYVKKGYKATWEPSNENITGDTVCYGQFDEFTFASASWADVAEVSEKGLASSYFSVGDQKVIEYNGSTATIAIIGFDHDDLADGTGKAGITCMTYSSVTPTVKWGTSTAPVLYASSVLHSTLNSTILGYLSEELQSVIKPVLKQCDDQFTSDYSPKTVNVTAKLWALSDTEMGKSVLSNTKYVTKLGKKYSGTIELTNLLPINGQEFWLRTFSRLSATGASPYGYCRSAGNIRATYGTEYITTARRLVFGFCI